MPHRILKEIVAGQHVLSATPDDTVADVVGRMQAHRFSCMPILDADGLVGVFTSSNLVKRVLEPGLDPATTRTADVMTPDPVCMNCECQGIEAIQLMKERQIHHLIVIGAGGEVTGVVTRSDFPASEIAEIEEELAFEQRLWDEL